MIIPRILPSEIEGVAITWVTEDDGQGVASGAEEGKDHEFHFGPAKFQMLFGYPSREVKWAFERRVQERGLSQRYVCGSI